MMMYSIRLICIYYFKNVYKYKYMNTNLYKYIYKYKYINTIQRTHETKRVIFVITYEITNFMTTVFQTMLSITNNKMN